MKNQFLLLIMGAAPFTVLAQPDPTLASWIQNTTGQLGYNNIESNVQLVQYTPTDVYVTCTCIPGYDIGPWAGNPNTPANQNFLFKITRAPQENTGTKIATGLGHIGVWTNGVSMFNAKDAMSYNNQGYWNQDALPNEGASFDACLGHPAPNGEYHHHVNPTCLYDDQITNMHSPLIGYAFDGFPVYGAYAYSNPSQVSTITRMRTGYSLRNITTRTTLPDGTVLLANQYGPAVSTQYPLGKYIEDYEFLGNGDLDQYNGRFCITPDYPQGTYAYFVTIDVNGTPVYPYTLGAKYYGTVPMGNTGPQGGHNTVPGTATIFDNAVGIDEHSENNEVWFDAATASLYLNVPTADTWEVEMMDATGRICQTSTLQTAVGQTITLTISGLAPGVHIVRLTSASGSINHRFIHH